MKNYNDFKDFNKKKEWPPVISLYGDERFLISYALSEIKKIESKELIDFNFNSFDLINNVFDDILIAANSLPIISNKRFIEVYNIGKINIFDLKKFKNYLKNPSTTTCMVIILEETIKPDSEVFTILKKKSLIFNFKKLKSFEMHKYIIDKIKFINLKLTLDAFNALKQIVNNDLMMLENSLEKLKIYTDSNEININNIFDNFNLCFKDKFKLAIWVAIGDKKKSLICINELRLVNDIVLSIINIIAWEFRLILKAKLMIIEDNSDFFIIKKLCLFGDNKKIILNLAKKYSMSIHMERLSVLSFVDFQVKNSSISDWFLLEDIIIKLCDIINLY